MTSGAPVRIAPVFVLLVIALALASSAEAQTTISAESAPTYQRWIDRARVPTPPVEVVIHEEWCPSEAPWGGSAPCAQGNEIWLGQTRTPRRILFHELGHVLDWTVLSDADRDAFRQIIGDSRPWVSSPNSPSEQFAEAYQWCARFEHLPRPHKRVGPAWSTAYGYVPHQRQHAEACALIDAAS